MAPKSAKQDVAVTRPQTEDELGSELSEDDQRVSKSRDDKRGKKMVNPPPEEEEEEEDEDEEGVMEEEEEEEEDDDAEDEEELSPTQTLPPARFSTKTVPAAKTNKSLKSVKKPLGKPGSGATKNSIRKRLQMDLAPTTVRRRILQERFTPNTAQSTGVFMATAMETFMRELIDAAVSVAQERKGEKKGKTKLTVQDIQKAVRVDEEFANIFQNVMFATHSVKAYEAVGVAKSKGKVGAKTGADDDGDD